IEQNGGGDNAWTENEYTVFYFNILSDYFEKALDRFSQFFIAPLFPNKYLDKERHAVDSEFQLHQKSDIHAIFSVDSVTANPTHPFHRFSIGNLETLKDHPNKTLEEAVKEFYYSHY